MSEPTIRLASCRTDGRCPECERDWTERGVLSLLPLPPCGCHCCPDCGLGHTRALLTEALRQRADYSARAKASMLIAEARTGPGHDCFFREERDAAIEERDAALRERDDALRQVEEQRHPCPCGKDTASIKWARCYSCRQAYHGALQDVETWRAKALRVAAAAEAMEKERDSARGVIDDLRESLDRQEEEIAQITRERDEYRKLYEDTYKLYARAQEERDEARATKDMHKERQEDLEITVQIERERAERAEALLRKCRDTLREVRQTYGPEPGARVIGLSVILAELDEALGGRP